MQEIIQCALGLNYEIESTIVYLNSIWYILSTFDLAENFLQAFNLGSGSKLHCITMELFRYSKFITSKTSVAYERECTYELRMKTCSWISSY